MINEPLISVVIPVYNEAEFLPRCLESLRLQKNAPNYEIIVVDNASTDNTAAIARKYGTRVVYESNKGVVFAREAGRKVAKGKIIVSTDADCFFGPNWLKNIDHFFKNHPDASGLAGHYYFYKGPLWSLIFPTLGAVLVWMISILFNSTIYASAANLSFLADSFDGYDTKYFQGGDERGVIKKLKNNGRVYVTLKNSVNTSSRRINQGFWHSILVTIGYYYSYNAWLTKKQGASSIGALPAIRDEARYAHWQLVFMQWVIVALIFVLMVWLII